MKGNDALFTTSYEHNRLTLARLLRCDDCFDIIERNIVIAGKKAVIFYINGLIKDDIMEKLMEFFYNNTRPEYLQSAEEFCRHCVPYVEISVVKKPDEVVKNVLSGIPCLLAEGFTSAISFDMRTYPQRSTSGPRTTRCSAAARTALSRPSSSTPR